MKFLTYNIRYTLGQDDRRDLDRIVDEITGADIIALQEVERVSPSHNHDNNHQDQACAIAKRLPDHFWIYGGGVDLHVPHSTPANNTRRQFGNMLLSRQPIQYARHHLLPKYASTGPLSIQRSALEAMVEINGRPLRLYSIHLTHLSAATRLPQVEQLLAIHRNAAFEGTPVCGDLAAFDWADRAGSQTVPQEAILLGDFNFQPDSREYDLVVGPVSDYGGRIANPCGFVDAWCAAGHDPAAGFTSDVNDKPARLDYCFVSHSLASRVRACRVDEDAVGSDHFPLWTEIDL